MLRSSYHLLCDVLVCSLLWYAGMWIDNLAVSKLVAFGVLWPAYWFCQGAFATGIWVIAHECGHGAFSTTPWVNDAVGLVFHSLLLVPYYSWKHSHRRHHQNTGSVTRDEVFVPLVKDADYDNSKSLWHFSFYRAGHLLLSFTAGWPLYLMFNVSGRRYDRFANHFDPYSPIFTKKERVEVLVSDVALIAVISGLMCLARFVGGLALLKLYVIPILVVNFWLVMITLLQHTHPNLPHYDDEEWEWLRGALCTVDRNYGFLNTVFHNITDTHVVHHLFSQMPHYHALEATKAVRGVLGDYYVYDSRNIWYALWSDFRKCEYVAPDKKDSHIFWFKS